MGDLYRYFFNVLTVHVSFLKRKRTVSSDNCAAGVTQWTGKHW